MWLDTITVEACWPVVAAFEPGQSKTGSTFPMCYGPEFTGQLVDLWAYHHGVQIDLSRPGKPTDNASIETFNGSLRDECLNLHSFETLAEARPIVEAWRRDYSERRPCSVARFMR